MKKKILIVFLIFLYTNCFPASNKIYSWVDNDGIRHFSDSPTYDAEKEAQGTEQFLIDRHGNKQPIKNQKQIEVITKEKTPANQNIYPKSIAQKKLSEPKSGNGYLNLNLIDLLKPLIKMLYPILGFIALLALIKLVVLSNFKRLKYIIIDHFKPNQSKKNENEFKWQKPNNDSPEFKGFEGEQIIIDLLYSSLDREKYHFFNDLTLPDNKGTTQIDHLIVSAYGIFIIETKNRAGSIYGNPYQKNWTQWISNAKYPFQNPFRQNYKHQKCLNNLLKIESEILFSVVIFTENAKFPKGKPNNVYYPNEFIKFLKSKHEILLSENEIKKIVSVIDSNRIEPSFETEKKHKEYVESILNDS